MYKKNKIKVKAGTKVAVSLTWIYLEMYIVSDRGTLPIKPKACKSAL